MGWIQSRKNGSQINNRKDSVLKHKYFFIIFFIAFCVTFTSAWGAGAIGGPYEKNVIQNITDFNTNPAIDQNALVVGIVAKAASASGQARAEIKFTFADNSYVSAKVVGGGSDRAITLSNKSIETYGDAQFALRISKANNFLVELLEMDIDAGFQRKRNYGDPVYAFPGDSVALGVEYGVIVFYVNGTKIYTNTSVPLLPLRISLFVADATVDQAGFSDVKAVVLDQTPYLSGVGCNGCVPASLDTLQGNAYAVGGKKADGFASDQSLVNQNPAYFGGASDAFAVKEYLDPNASSPYYSANGQDGFAALGSTVDYLPLYLGGSGDAFGTGIFDSIPFRPLYYGGKSDGVGGGSYDAQSTMFAAYRGLGADGFTQETSMIPVVAAPPYLGGSGDAFGTGVKDTNVPLKPHYAGGTADGFDVRTSEFDIKRDVEPIYYGGEADGHSSYAQIIIKQMVSYSGGEADGHASAGIKAFLKPQFSGGVADGNVSYAMKAATKPQFSGGVADGHTSVTMKISTKPQFSGGVSDGHASFSMNTKGQGQYAGGVADGSHSFAMKAIVTPQFTGGVADGNVSYEMQKFVYPFFVGGENDGFVMLQTPCATVTFNPKSNSPVCPKDTLFLTVDTIPGASYLWEGPNNFVSTKQNPFIPNYQASMAGTYKVSINLGCGDDAIPMKSLTVTTAAAMPVTASIDSIFPGKTACQSDPVTFKVKGKNWGTNPTFVWYWNGMPDALAPNDSVYVNTKLATGNTIACAVYSSYFCTDAKPKMSAAVSMTVRLTDSVNSTIASNKSDSISAIGSISYTDVCANDTSLVFTSAIQNLGMAAGGYSEWLLNEEIFRPATPNGLFKPTSFKDQDTVRLIVYSGALCPDQKPKLSTNLIILNVHTPSVVDAGEDQDIAPGGSVTLEALGADPGSTYVWSPNSGLNYTNRAAVVSTPAATTKYKVVATTPWGCSTSDTVMVYVITGTSIRTHATNQTICAGSLANFTVKASGTRLSYQWQYNKNDGNGWLNCEDASATQAQVFAGVNTTTLIVGPYSNGIIQTLPTDASMNGWTFRCRVIADKGTEGFDTVYSNNDASHTPALLTVKANQFSNPVITASTTDYTCLSDELVFTIQTDTVEKNATYVWMVNNKIVSGATSTSFKSKTLKNDDTVKALVYSALACAKNLADTSNVLAVKKRETPRVSIAGIPVGNPIVLSLDQTAELHAALSTDDTAGLTYLWSPANRLTSTTAAVTQTTYLTTPGWFKVVITDRYGCQSSDSIRVTISGSCKTLAVTPATETYEICEGNTANIEVFTSGSSGSYVYHWTSIPDDPYLDPNYIEPEPVNPDEEADGSEEAPVVPDEEVEQEEGEPENYVEPWARTLKPKENTVYTIRVIDDICEDTVYKTAIVNINKKVENNVKLVYTNAEFCEGGTFDVTTSISDVNKAVGYFWYVKAPGSTKFTMVNTSSKPSIKIPDLVNNSLVMCAVTPSKFCVGTENVNSDTVKVTVNSLPAATVSKDTVICKGESVLLTATGGDDYAWTPATGLNATATATVTATPSATTTYSVTVTDYLYGCSKVLKSTVTVKNVDSLLVNVDKTFATDKMCANTNEVFTARDKNTGVAKTYQWYLDGQILNTEQNKNFNLASLSSSLSVGDHSVYCVVTANDRCLQNNPATTALLNFSVIESPVVSISGDYAINYGNTVSLSADVTGGLEPYTYLWSPASSILNSANIQSIQTQPLFKGTLFNVSVTDSIGCTASKDLWVTLLGGPLEVSITGISAVCEGGPVQLIARASGGEGVYTYEWSETTTSKGAVAIPTVTSTTNKDTIDVVPPTSRIYTVKVEDGKNSATASYTVRVDVASVISTPVPASGVICNNTSADLSVSNSVGTLSWEQSADLVSWNSASGTGNTSVHFISNAITSAMYYRVTAKNGVCPAVTSSSALVNVINAIQNTIKSSVSEICPEQFGIIKFTETTAGGGSSYTYAWERSTTSATSGFTQAPGTNDESTYQFITNLDHSSWFRRKVTSAGCQSYSNVEFVSLIPASNGGTIEAEDSICLNTNTPLTLNNYVGKILSWEYKTAATSGFTAFNASGSETVTSLAAAVPTQYRALVQNKTCASIYSDTITVAIKEPAVVSVTIKADSTNICSYDSVEFTAFAVNAGKTPIYRWMLNGKVLDPNNKKNTIKLGALNNGDTVSCEVQSSNTCVVQLTAQSNKIGISVITPYAVIIGPAYICLGDTATLRAVGGVSYVWSAGVANDDSTRVSPRKEAKYYVETTDDHGCKATDSFTLLPEPIITINTDTTVCLDSKLELFAKGPELCVYEWSALTPIIKSVDRKKQQLLTDTITEKTTIYVKATSMRGCVAYDSVLVDIEEISKTNITVDYEGDRIGDTIIINACHAAKYLTATIEEGGDAPQLNWYVNNVLRDSGINKFSILDTGMSTNSYIVAEMISSKMCVTEKPIRSTPLIVNKIPRPEAGITINHNQEYICQTDTVLFFAAWANGGATPKVIWFRNNKPVVADNMNTLGDSTWVCKNLVDGDAIYAYLISSDSCVTAPTVKSNTLNIKVIKMSYPSLKVDMPKNGSVCAWESVNFNAVPTNAGTNPTFTWYINGCEFGTGKTILYDGGDNEANNYCGGMLEAQNGQNTKYRIMVEMEVDLTCALPKTVIIDTVLEVRPYIDPSIEVVQDPASGACSNYSEELVSWTNLRGVAMQDGQILANDASGWGSSGAFSKQRIYDKGYVTTIAIAQTSPAHQMIGFSTTDRDASYSSIEWALYLNNGSLEIYESGAHKVSLGTYKVGDEFKVETFGDSIVYYFKNNEVVYTSTKKITKLPLFVDASLYNNNSGLDSCKVMSKTSNLMFVANPKQAGGNPTYNWWVNKEKITLNDTIYYDPYRVFLPTDNVICQLVSNYDCTYKNTVSDTVQPLVKSYNLAVADTIACYGDTVQLNTKDAVSCVWRPDSYDSLMPFVAVGPAKQYMYFATGADGCTDYGYVFVDAYPQLISKVLDNPQICYGDSLWLTTSGGPGRGQYFHWTALDGSLDTIYVDTNFAAHSSSMTLANTPNHGGFAYMKQIGDSVVKVVATGDWQYCGSTQQITSGNGTTISATYVTPGVQMGYRQYASGTYWEHIWHVDPNGSLYIREHAAATGSSIYSVNSTAKVGDVFSIQLEGTTVKYYQNGRLMYVSTKQARYPLTSFIGLYNVGSALSDLRFSVIGLNVKPEQTTTYAVEIGAGICSVKDTVTVTVNPLPDFVPMSDTSVCKGSAIDLYAESTNTKTWTWTPTTNLVKKTTDGSVVTVSPTKSTNYLVKLTTEAGCSSSDTVYVEATDLRTLTATLTAVPNDTVCEGKDEIRFEVSGSLFGDTSHYAWYWNGQLVAEAGDTAVWTSSSLSNKNTVWAEVTTNARCVTSQSVTTPHYTVKAQTINENTVRIEGSRRGDDKRYANEINLCVGDSVLITSTYSLASKDPKAYFIWYLNGDSIPGVHGRELNIKALNDGDIIEFSATSALYCVDVVTAYSNQFKINVHPTPIVNAYQDTTIDVGNSAHLHVELLSGTAGAYKVKWTGMWMTTSDTLRDILVAPTSSITYKAQMTDEWGCFGYDTVKVIVNLPPRIVQSPLNMDVCEHGRGQLYVIASGTIVGLQWYVDKGDGIMRKLENYTHASPTPFYGVDRDTLMIGGTLVNGVDLLPVELFMNDWKFYCVAQGLPQYGSVTSKKARLTVTGNVHAETELLLSTTDTVCYGTKITLSTKDSTPGPTPLHYWYVNGKYKAQAPNFSYAFHPNDTVSCIYQTSERCVWERYDTVSTVINVWDAPLVNIRQGRNITIDYGTEAYLSAEVSGGLPMYYNLWQPSTFVQTPTDTATYITNVTEKTDYVFRVTDQHGCTGRDTITVWLKNGPLKAYASASTTASCEADSVLLTGSASGGSGTYTYTWTANPTDTTLKQEDINRTSLYVNTYRTTTYTLTVNDGSSTAQATVRVTVKPYENLFAKLDLVDPSVCVGDNVTFNARAVSGASTPAYQWTKNGLPLAGQQKATYTAQAEAVPATYGVILTSDLQCVNNRYDTAYTTIQPKESPMLWVSDDTTICEQNPVPLAAYGNGTFKWTSSQPLSNPNIDTPLATPDTTVYYNVTLTAANGCKATDRILVVVEYGPERLITQQPQDFVSCNDGEKAVFQINLANQKNITYQWQENTGNGWNNLTNGGNYSGVNTSKLEIANLTRAKNGAQYRVFMTNHCRSGYSQAATLRTPEMPQQPILLSGDSTYCFGTSIAALHAQINDPVGVLAWYDIYGNKIAEGVDYQPYSSKGYRFVGDNLVEETNSKTLPVGTYTYTAKELHYGCAGPGKDIAITVLPEPNPQLPLAFPGCAEMIVLTARNGASYLWSTGETTASIIVNNVTSSGVYKVVITTAAGCKGRGQTTVLPSSEGGVLSAVAFTTATGTICNGAKEAVYVNIRNGGDYPYYRWYVDGVVVGEPIVFAGLSPDTLDLSKLSPGIHQIYCEVFSSERCVAPRSMATNTITVEILPAFEIKATATSPVLANAEPAFLGTNIVSPGVAPYAYSWQPANLVANPLDKDPMTKYLSESELFKLTVTDARGCEAKDSVDVLVYGGPLKIKSCSATSPLCLGDITRLHVQPSGGATPNYSYNWSIVSGDMTSLNGIDPTQRTIYPAPDKTTIYRVIIGNNGETVQCEQTVVVYQPVVAGTVASPTGIQCAASDYKVYLSGYVGENIQWQITDDTTGGGMWRNISGQNTDSLVGNYGFGVQIYIRAWINSGLCSSAVSDVVAIEKMPAVANNVISPADLNICPNISGFTINATTPMGGMDPGNYQYFWEYSTVSEKTGFQPAWGANTGETYISTQGLSQKTWFRRRVTSGICSEYSNVTYVGVYGTTVAGAIAGETAVCYDDPAYLYVQSSVGNSFKWQYSVNDSLNWTAFAGGSTNIVTPKITQPTYIRVIVNNHGCTPDTSNAYLVSIQTPQDAKANIYVDNTEVCKNATATFHVETQSIGDNPRYKWMVNGTPAPGTNNQSVYASTKLSNGDRVICRIYPSIASMAGKSNNCYLDSIDSDPITMTVYTPQPQISKDTNLCNGSSATIIASGGVSYRWMDGVTTATRVEKPAYTTTYSVVVTDVHGCVDSAKMNMVPFPQVLANDTIICLSDDILVNPQLTLADGVTIRALDGVSLPAANMHIEPAATTDYEVIVYNNTLISGITCMHRDTMRVKVNQWITPKITISSSQMVGDTLFMNECEGLKSTFVATVTDGGTAPKYQWIANGIDQKGETQPTFNFVSSNNTYISCRLTSNEYCLLQNPIVSNFLVLRVQPSPDVLINVNANTGTDVCGDEEVLFYMSTSHGGTNPSYQWYYNNIPVPAADGGKDEVYRKSGIKNGDEIYCRLYSSDTCVKNNPAKSNILKMKVSPAVTPSVNFGIARGASICEMEDATFTAKTVGQGPTPSYTWTVNGVPYGNASTFKFGANYHVKTSGENDTLLIRCEMVSSLTCATIPMVSKDTFIVFRTLEEPDVYIINSASDQEICANIVSEPVEWTAFTNDYNGYLSANSGNIWKTYCIPSHGDGCGHCDWNTGAISKQQITDNGSVSTVPTNRLGHQMLGISSSNPNGSYTSINYALYLDYGTLYVYENGAQIINLGTYFVGDVLKVEVADGVVRYFRNEIMLYRSKKAATNFPMFADVSFYNPYSHLDNVNIEYRKTDVSFYADVVSDIAKGNNAKYEWTLNGKVVKTAYKDSSLYLPYTLLKTGDKVNVKVTLSYDCVNENYRTIEADRVSTLKVKTFTMDMIPDTSVCIESGIALYANSGAQYLWTPITMNVDDTTEVPEYIDVYDTAVEIDYIVPTTPADTIWKNVITHIKTDTNWLNRITTRITQSTEANPIVMPLKLTSYKALVSDENGCNTFGRSDVQVIPLPDINAGKDTSVCPGSSVILSSNAKANSATELSYEWYSLDGKYSYNGQTITIIADSSRYWIARVYGDNGCERTDTMLVNTHFVPTNTGIHTVVTCAKEPIKMYATGGISYAWSPAKGLDVADKDTVVATVDTTQYYFVDITTANGCVFRDSVRINVNPLPKIKFADTIITMCKDDDPIQLNPVVTAPTPTYQWSPVTVSSGLKTPTILNPIVAPDTTTTYTLKVVDIHGCINSANVTVAVAARPFVAFDRKDTLIYDHVHLDLGPSEVRGDNLTYEWSPVPAAQKNNPVLDVYSDTAKITVYTLKVTNATGCWWRDDIKVIVKKEDTINVAILSDIDECCIHKTYNRAIWTNQVNVKTVGGTLHKLNKTETWNSGAFSYESIKKVGFIDARISQMQQPKVIGLSHEDVDASYTTIDYGFYMKDSNRLTIIEKGVLRPFDTTFNVGDVLAIMVDADQKVKYIRNGVLVYTSTVKPTLPLHVDAALGGEEAIMSEIRIVNIASKYNVKAIAKNGGPRPLYHWYKNGEFLGVDSIAPVGLYKDLIPGDQFVIALETSDPKAKVKWAYDTITYQGNCPFDFHDLKIEVVKDPFCAFEEAELKASITEINGLPLIYNWYVDGIFQEAQRGQVFKMRELEDGMTIKMDAYVLDTCRLYTQKFPLYSSSIYYPHIQEATIVLTGIRAYPDTIVCPGAAMVMNVATVNKGIKPYYHWYRNWVEVCNEHQYAFDDVVDGDEIFCFTNPSDEILCPDMQYAQSEIIKLKVRPRPLVQVCCDKQIQPGDIAILNVTNSDGTVIRYQWAPTVPIKDNSTPTSIIVNPIATTIFTVTGYDEHGCEGSDTVVVTVEK